MVPMLHLARADGGPVTFQGAPVTFQGQDAVTFQGAPVTFQGRNSARVRFQGALGQDTPAKNTSIIMVAAGLGILAFGAYMFWDMRPRRRRRR
jgi:hypothetical protein